MRVQRVVILSLAMSLVLAMGCAQMVDRTINRSIGSAADRVGDQMGKAIAGHIMTNLTPELMRAYSLGLFQLMFYHGGYNVSLENYEPGQYTRWDASGLEQGDWFERALLRRNEDGTEWWRVESHAKDEDGKPVVLIMEALFGEEDEHGNRRVRRMKAKFPHEREAAEIPITEADSDTWIVRSNRQLTPESLEGMSQGVVSVETPAGTFQAQHLRTSHGGGALNWWVVEDGVPGQLVRYSQESTQAKDDQETVYDVRLMAYGSDATTSKLGVF